MSLEKHKKSWEELANMDPYWAIVTEKNRQYGKWKVEEFFQTGEYQIQTVMKSLSDLGYPKKRQLMLDFGCGVGRHTRIFCRYFSQAIGIDISERMIVQALKLNQSVSNCKFLVNSEPHLKMLPDNHFDLVYSDFVLQHISNKKTIRSYISEFIRIIKPNGLAIFQLPHHISFRNRLQPRRKIYNLLRSLGVNEQFLYGKLGLHPICSNFVPQPQVEELLKIEEARVLKLLTGPDCGPSVDSRIYFVSK